MNHRRQRWTVGTLLLGALWLGAGASCRTSRAQPAGATASHAATPTGSGLCPNACDKYLACGGEMSRPTCVEECAFIYADDEALASLMTMQCAAYVSYIDGPAAGATK